MSSRDMARKFVFDWRITALVVLLLPVLIGLGFWQLHRAETNRAVMRQAEQQHQVPPVPLADLVQNKMDNAVQATALSWHLKPVMLRGRWLDEVFVLENQIYGERNGYYVFGVMQLDNNLGVMLVNRGWLPAPAVRSELPVIPPVGVGEEVGEVYEAVSWHDAKPTFAESGWPKRVGRMNLAGAEQELQSKLLPVLVRLTTGSPSALAVEWPIVNIQPEKNTAYAIQWFAMAFALLLCYGFYSFRAEPKNSAVIPE